MIRLYVGKNAPHEGVAALDMDWGYDLYNQGIVTREEPIPKHIELGHELAHALRSALGYALDNGNAARVPYRRANGVVFPLLTAREEIETIGLIYRNWNDELRTPLNWHWYLTENALRREQAEPLPWRITHWGELRW